MRNFILLRGFIKKQTKWLLRTINYMNILLINQMFNKDKE